MKTRIPTARDRYQQLRAVVAHIPKAFTTAQVVDRLLKEHPDAKDWAQRGGVSCALMTLCQRGELRRDARAGSSVTYSRLGNFSDNNGKAVATIRQVTGAKAA